MIVVLTGGTGGAKLVEGLAAVTNPADLTIVCNTGDDCIFHGLHISPDIDTIVYTMAGLNDADKGWGIKGDTFTALEQLRRLGNDAWFNLGDKDLAMHITRTQLLGEGRTLSEITAKIRRSLGVRATIMPMSDERVETFVKTPAGEIAFQEFFVRERWTPEVLGVRLAGVENSCPAPGVIEAIHAAEAIIVCPSNPVTSIGPILAVPGIRHALEMADAPVIGVSPVIGNSAISGPAHKLMLACGCEASALGVAKSYGDFLDLLLIDMADHQLVGAIERLDIQTVCADIRMNSAIDKARLAQQLLALIKK